MKVFDLSINISIRSSQGDNLNVSETVSIPTGDFLDVARVLGQFHDLAQSLRVKNYSEKKNG